MNRNWNIVFLLALFLLAMLYGSAPLLLPKPAAAQVPPDQFSAERAIVHVQNLAQYQRIAGSPGMEQAVNYVSQVLRTCHLEPEIQDFLYQGSQLNNIVVRIPGSDPKNAVLIVTHMDSISYGAGDNASGTAVLLEAACNLQAGNPMQNSVILLFEDGEELGYLGGYAYVKSDPALFSIQRVIGLDTAAWGPVVLLQTTPGNADFIRAYAAAVEKPTAFGFFAEADWSISHDTSEIQPFYEIGIPGLELEDPTAFTWKHTDADTVDKVKPGSLQQMGDQVVSLVRLLGNSELTSYSTTNRSYFTLWGIGVVNYPVTVNLVLILLAAVGLIVLTIKSLRNRTITAHNLLISIGLLIVILVAAAIIGQAASTIFARLFPNPNPKTGSYLIDASLPFFVSSLAVVVVLVLVARSQIKHKAGLPAVSLAGLYTWLIVAVLFLILLPVGSYLLAIPLFLAVLVRTLPGKNMWASAIPAVAGVVLLAPNAELAFIGAGMQPLVIITFLLALDVELWAEIE